MTDDVWNDDSAHLKCQSFSRGNGTFKGNTSVLTEKDLNEGRVSFLKGFKDF